MSFQGLVHVAHVSLKRISFVALTGTLDHSKELSVFMLPMLHAAPLPTSQSSVAQNGSSLFLWNWSLFLFNEWDTYPIGSMGLVYLPTFGLLYLYGKCS